MTKDEALKLALEALELHLAHHEHGCVYLDPAVTAIKEALAQPEQKLERPRLDQGPDYERGFVDGMLYQTQTSVDKAVNAMAQPEQEEVAAFIAAEKRKEATRYGYVPKLHPSEYQEKNT